MRDSMNERRQTQGALNRAEEHIDRQQKYQAQHHHIPHDSGHHPQHEISPIESRNLSRRHENFAHQSNFRNTMQQPRATDRRAVQWENEPPQQRLDDVRISSRSKSKRQFKRSPELQLTLHRLQRRKNADARNFNRGLTKEPEKVAHVEEMISTYDIVLDHLIRKNRDLNSFVKRKSSNYPEDWSLTSSEIVDTLEQLRSERRSSINRSGQRRSVSVPASQRIGHDGERRQQSHSHGEMGNYQGIRSQAEHRVNTRKQYGMIGRNGNSHCPGPQSEGSHETLQRLSKLLPERIPPKIKAARDRLSRFRKSRNRTAGNEDAQHEPYSMPNIQTRMNYEERLPRNSASRQRSHREPYDEGLYKEYHQREMKPWEQEPYITTSLWKRCRSDERLGSPQRPHDVDNYELRDFTGSPSRWRDYNSPELWQRLRPESPGSPERPLSADDYDIREEILLTPESAFDGDFPTQIQGSSETLPRQGSPQKPFVVDDHEWAGPATTNHYDRKSLIPPRMTCRDQRLENPRRPYYINQHGSANPRHRQTNGNYNRSMGSPERPYIVDAFHGHQGQHHEPPGSHSRFHRKRSPPIRVSGHNPDLERTHSDGASSASPTEMARELMNHVNEICRFSREMSSSNTQMHSDLFKIKQLSAARSAMIDRAQTPNFGRPGSLVSRSDNIQSHHGQVAETRQEALDQIPNRSGDRLLSYRSHKPPPPLRGENPLTQPDQVTHPEKVQYKVEKKPNGRFEYRTAAEISNKVYTEPPKKPATPSFPATMHKATNKVGRGSRIGPSRISQRTNANADIQFPDLLAQVRGRHGSQEDKYDTDVSKNAQGGALYPHYSLLTESSSNQSEGHFQLEHHDGYDSHALAKARNSLYRDPIRLSGRATPHATIGCGWGS